MRISRDILYKLCCKYKTYAYILISAGFLGAAILGGLATFKLGTIPNRWILSFIVSEVILAMMYIIMILLVPYKKLDEQLNEDKTDLSPKYDDSFFYIGSLLREIMVDQKNIMLWMTLVYWIGIALIVLVTNLFTHLFF